MESKWLVVQRQLRRAHCHASPLFQFQIDYTSTKKRKANDLQHKDNYIMRIVMIASYFIAFRGK